MLLIRRLWSLPLLLLLQQLIILPWPLSLVGLGIMVHMVVAYIVPKRGGTSLVVPSIIWHAWNHSIPISHPLIMLTMTWGQWPFLWLHKQKRGMYICACVQVYAKCSHRYISNLKYVSESCTAAIYCTCQLETGVCKPTIFSGLDPLCCLHIPTLFLADLMHLSALNMTKLVVGLLHRTLDCSPSDNRDS